MAKQLSNWELQISKRAGDSIRKQRELRNIDRETLGNWLGQSADAVAKAEIGKRRFSLADAVRISLEFGCSLDQLVFGEQPKPTIMRVVQFDPDGDGGKGDLAQRKRKRE